MVADFWSKAKERKKGGAAVGQAVTDAGGVDDKTKVMQLPISQNWRKNLYTVQSATRWQDHLYTARSPNDRQKKK